MKNKRFKEVYSKGFFIKKYKIIVDVETGVNYFFYKYDASGGLTPLLNEKGEVVTTKIEK